jgi:hypothetical protein
LMGHLEAKEGHFQLPVNKPVELKVSCSVSFGSC